VGTSTFGGWNRAGSAFAGISDTIAVGDVLYVGGFPIVPPDEYWILARRDSFKLSIIPISGIHLFICETIDSDGNNLVSNSDPTAIELDAIAFI
jgi:hypothetical protein